VAPFLCTISLHLLSAWTNPSTCAHVSLLSLIRALVLPLPVPSHPATSLSLALAVYKLPPQGLSMNYACSTSVGRTTGEHEYTPFQTKITKGVISEQYSYFVSTAIRFIKDVLRGQIKRLNPHGLITLNTM